MVVYAPAQIISAPAQLITAAAQLPATGAVVFTALLRQESQLNRMTKGVMSTLNELLYSAKKNTSFAYKNFLCQSLVD